MLVAVLPHACLVAAHAHSPPLMSGVAGFDIYRDGPVLHLLTAEFDRSRVLLYQQSRDQGVTWTAPIRVNQGGAAVHDIVRGNDPQVAAYGKQVVAVWTAKGSGYGGSGPLVTAVSHDEGRTWRAGRNPADDGTNAGHAYIDLAAGPEGFDLVWLDGRDGSQGLRHAQSRDGVSPWSRNATVQKTTCECCWNSLSRRDDALFVMLRGRSPRDMLLAERGADGKWQARGTVGKFGWRFKGCPHTGGGIAWSGAIKSGEMLHAIVWTGAASVEGLHYLASSDRGRTWGLPHRVGTLNARRADIAASNDGLVLLAWDQLEGERRTIYAMQSPSSGRHWFKPVRISSESVDAAYPRVTETAAGFLIVWTENEKGAPAVLRMRTVAAIRQPKLP